MIKKSVAALLLAAMFFTVGCMGHTHVIGEGGKSGVTESAKQWYILWGLVPLNDANTSQMAGGAKDYTVKTEISFIDFVISMVTGMITVVPRSVTVTK